VEGRNEVGVLQAKLNAMKADDGRLVAEMAVLREGAAMLSANSPHASDMPHEFEPGRKRGTEAKPPATKNQLSK
jgi:hypothetical protein